MSVDTYGLTHVALAVRDPQRSLSFYRAVLGVIPVYEEADFVQAQTPGTRDVLVFERKPRAAGKIGGIAHFGFRLQRAGDMDLALQAIRAAGGTIREHGEFVPGEPYVFFSDPDGYEVEIWYELPTPVDPQSTKGTKANTKGTKQNTKDTKRSTKGTKDTKESTKGTKEDVKGPTKTRGAVRART